MVFFLGKRDCHGCQNRFLKTIVFFFHGTLAAQRFLDLTFAHKVSKFKYSCDILGSCDIAHIGPCNILHIILCNILRPCNIALFFYVQFFGKYLSFTCYGANVRFKNSCTGNISLFVLPVGSYYIQKTFLVMADYWIKTFRGLPSVVLSLDLLIL